MAFGAVQAQSAFTTYFDFDLDEASVPSSQKLSTWIKNNANAEIVKIHAYADTTGNALYNVDLSERRAKHVLQQLQENNIPVAENVELKGFGETKSVSHKAKERKAVIYYRDKQVVATTPPRPATFGSKVANAKVGERLKVPNLNFYNYSDVVLPQSEKVLWELLDIMRAHADLKIDIQGHICCEVLETDEISRKRAEAVYKFLIRGGIDKGRLSYHSFGSSRPIYQLPEKNEAERIANRRVEIEILEKANPDKQVTDAGAL